MDVHEPPFFACSATIGDIPFPDAMLVILDIESSGQRGMIVVSS